MKSKENLVFLGMMGSGKSSIGSLVAKKLKLNFVDIDKVIEKNLTFKLPFGVSIIGYDGELKFKSERFVSLKDLILIVDKMPLRIKEKKFDKSC